MKEKDINSLDHTSWRSQYHIVFAPKYRRQVIYREIKVPILQKIGSENFQYKANDHDTIYPVILSGVISGIVYGICFRKNSSTSGTDIISKYISKINPSFNFFKITFILNAIVAVVSFFVYAKPTGNDSYAYDYKPVCLGLMYCFISTFVGDFMIKGTKKLISLRL